MNNNFLRFLSFFIILMFCMMPLNANCMNHEDNSGYMNQYDNKSGVSPEDMNISVDVVDEDDMNASDEVVDDREDVIPDDLNVSEDVEDVNASLDDELNESDDLESTNRDISIHVDDVYVGDTTFVEIDSTNTTTRGVFVYCDDELYHVLLENGHGSISFENLPIGYHVIAVDDYNVKGSGIVFGDFHVLENIVVEVSDISPGQRAVAQVHMLNDYEGKVKLALDDLETKIIDIENNKGEVTFDEDLRPGQYTVEATTLNCPGSIQSHNTTEFTVDHNLIIDMDYPACASSSTPFQMKFNTTKHFDGGCVCVLSRFNLLGCEYMKDGRCSVDLGCLDPGDYHLFVIAAGTDPDYNLFESYVDFKIIDYSNDTLKSR